MATRLRDPRQAADPHAHHRDTPPEDVGRVEVGLLARGSSLPSAFPGSPSGTDRRRLTAHSCGGSAGLVPIKRSVRTGFPLGSGAQQSRRPRPQDYGGWPSSRQEKYKDIFISLYTLKALPLAWPSNTKAIPCSSILQWHAHVAVVANWRRMKTDF
jgi:hypothetical protein